MLVILYLTLKNQIATLEFLMGQNQLLQLVLAAIVAAIALVVGINLSASSAGQANKDAVISDLNQLIAIARSHYRRPVLLGGGGRSFANFSIPVNFSQNENGIIKHKNKNHNPDHIHFEATGKKTGTDDINSIRIEVRITIDEIKWKKHN